MKAQNVWGPGSVSQSLIKSFKNTPVQSKPGAPSAKEQFSS